MHVHKIHKITNQYRIWHMISSVVLIWKLNNRICRTDRVGWAACLLLHAYRARICKPFKEPRNRFPDRRNWFLGIDSWAPSTFTNTYHNPILTTEALAYVNCWNERLLIILYYNMHLPVKIEGLTFPALGMQRMQIVFNSPIDFIHPSGPAPPPPIH